MCLHLQALEELSIRTFRTAAIMLDCPQLKSLSLSFLTLLQAFSGTPPSLEVLEITFLAGGSSPLESVLASERLEELTELTLTDCDGAPRNLGTCCFNSNLTSLQTDCHLELMFPASARWPGPLSNLQHLEVAMLLVTAHCCGVGAVHKPEGANDRQVLMQPSNALRRRSKWYRPMDPFLDLPSLQKLELVSGHA